MRLPVEPKLPDLPVRSVAEMGLKELERVRLILRGGSVIEWRRLHFQEPGRGGPLPPPVRLDLSHPDGRGLGPPVLVRRGRVPAHTFNYRVADVVARPAEMHDLFLFASG